MPMDNEPKQGGMVWCGCGAVLLWPHEPQLVNCAGTIHLRPVRRHGKGRGCHAPVSFAGRLLVNRRALIRAIEATGCEPLPAAVGSEPCDGK